MSDLIFLTDGHTFLGPYQVGDLAIARGTRTLEHHGALQVFAVSADDEQAARAAWAANQGRLLQQSRRSR